MTTTPNIEYCKAAYKLGRKHIDLSYYDETVTADFDRYHVDAWDVEWLFYEIGKEGSVFPVYVTGWRYGDIPEGGRSYNHREDCQEKGCSMMQIDGQGRCKSSLAELRGSFDNRPIVRVGGWLHPTEVGGDSEPLLLDPIAI